MDNEGGTAYFTSLVIGNYYKGFFAYKCKYVATRMDNIGGKVYENHIKGWLRKGVRRSKKYL